MVSNMEDIKRDQVMCFRHEIAKGSPIARDGLFWSQFFFRSGESALHFCGPEKLNA